MAYAHARGVIHRDLKPANIMVGAFGEVQVMDWGLAKLLDTEPGEGLEEPRTAQQASEVGPRSQPGTVLGTLAYMPPEQARGQLDEIATTSDVWSLGAILTEILTGAPPYVAEQQSELRKLAADADVSGAIARLSDCGADPELIAIARQCLAELPGARPVDARALAKAVAAYVSAAEERARTAELEANAARIRVVGERRARRLAVALALSLALGGGVYLWMQRASRLRREEATKVVEAALTETNRLWREAKSDSTGEASWSLALGELATAEAAVAAGQANEATRERVASLAASLRSEADAAVTRIRRQRAEHRLSTELSRIRDEVEQSERKLDAAMARAFREFGIDLDDLTAEEAANRLRETDIATELGSYLDDWARIRRRARNSTSGEWDKLFDVALLVDDDSWRSRLRKALRIRDRKAILDLAKTAPIGELPAVTLSLLGTALTTIGEHATAVELLRKAQRRFSGDYWINRKLAQSFELVQPPRWREAATFYHAVLAIRPDVARARIDLSVALRELGDTEEADREFAAALTHDNGQECCLYLASKLTDVLHDYDAAIAVARKSLREFPDKNATVHYNLGCALAAQGKLEDAAKAFGNAIETAKTHPPAYNNLGKCLRDLGRTDDAEAVAPGMGAELEVKVLYGTYWR